jgi:Amt family ammonium transporter
LINLKKKDIIPSNLLEYFMNILLKVLKFFTKSYIIFFTIILSLFSYPVMAEVDSGDTAWVLTSTALVLFMTLPGLALFYAGLVNSKNVVSVLMQHFALACLVSIIWVVIGYSLAFTPGNLWIGDLSNLFMTSINLDSISGTIPESLFATFQMTFAIITPALIIGALLKGSNFQLCLFLFHYG